MKLGVFLLVLSALCITAACLAKGDPEMIDINSGGSFFGLLFMVCGGACILGGE